jgi:hypothetical protein
MEFRYFILFRNKEYAHNVATKLNGIVNVRNSESEILSIRPQEIDVFLIDAHYGGQMSQLNGLEIASKLIKSRQGDDFRIIVYSWLSLESISHMFPERTNLLKTSKIHFIQNPTIISK